MLTNEIHICNFFTVDDVLVGKVTISASLKKINFLKISEQAPLRLFNPITGERIKKIQKYRPLERQPLLLSFVAYPYLRSLGIQSSDG